ncbi:MAG: TonB-dependent receptor [Bacteroidales bacterium]|jgi:TonB-linked SusC/RagA family outer membrane protein|nr:TonB-dependent receptor [Bacteroidales bacterium]HPH53074.1 TonB-dependent receptor [Bacteroidales bacterium]
MKKRTNNLLKIGIFFQFMVLSLFFSTEASAQQISLDFKGEKMITVLQEIQKQSSYNFIYNNTLVDVNQVVTISVSNASISQVLDRLFSGTSIAYRIIDKQITIFPKEFNEPQQQKPTSDARVVTGTVVDDKGEPLVGVSIQNVTTKEFTITDFEGNYSIKANQGNVLNFTYIGMESQSLTVGTSGVMNVTMQSDVQTIEELVVVGYGSAKKISSVVGASTLVKSDAFTSIPAASSGDALQGKVAGLQVFTSSGEPSATVSMRLRGVNSINASNTPLFILDGSPVDVAIFTALNPNDIENVMVMKDASSTAIYGSRAANGVIYITTKKGSGEKPTITASTSYGISSLAQFPMDLMSSEEWFQFREIADPSLLENEQFQELKNFRLKNNIGTDWRKWILNEKAPTWKADISASGRSERTDFYISLGAFAREGVEPYSDMSRYSIRSNTNTRITDWFKFGINLNLAYQTQRNAGYSTVSTGYYNPMNIIAWGLPYATPYEILTDANGNFTGYGEELDFITDLGMKNYFTIMEHSPTRKKTVRVNANMYQEITPIKGLVLRAVQAVEGYDYRYTGKTIPTERISVTPITEEAFERFYRLTSTNTAEYKFAIAGKNHFDLLVGHESIISKDDYLSTHTQGQTDPRLTNIDHGTEAFIPSYSESKIAYNSFFSRLSYDYADRYFLDLTYRVDGSSLFGAERRYANFWSVGAMWKMSNEDFIKGISWINNLQLKASYGTMGNSGISNYLSYGLTKTGKTYDGESSWYISSLGNPNLTWETLEAFNIGINGTIFDFLTFNFEFYNKNTKDMLMYIPYSFISGFSGGWGNVGTMRNRGVDVELRFDIIQQRDLYFGASFNMNYNKNTITELYDGRDEFVDGDSGLKFQTGHAYGEYFVVRFAGVDPANGKSLWYDTDGNITSTYSESHAAFLGRNRFAPWSGGAALDLSWKGFSLNATFAGVFGKYIENYDRYFVENPTFADESNMTKRMMNIWTTPGQITDIPKASEPVKHDSRFIENASFVRLKNLQIAYTFPKKMIAKTNIFSGAKIYVSGRNLLTFTKYTGWDPEIDQITAMGNYPNTRQYIVGLEFNF